MKTYLIIATLFFAFLISSCEKDVENEVVTEDLITSAQDDDEAYASFEDDETEPILGASEGLGLKNNLQIEGDSCRPSCTITPNVAGTLPNDPRFYPVKILIDFGNGCLRPNGRTKKGQIIVTLTGKMSQQGSIRTIRFKDFYIDSTHIEGVKIVTNNGLNAQQHPSWTTVVDSAKITRPNGKFITWKSTRTREMVEGFNTPSRWRDDVYAFKGGSSGTNSNGKSYVTTIDDSKPLIIAANCKWIRSGKISTVISTGKTITLDYGDGTCDNKATLTVNGKTKEITLRGK